MLCKFREIVVIIIFESTKYLKAKKLPESDPS